MPTGASVAVWCRYASLRECVIPDTAQLKRRLPDARNAVREPALAFQAAELFRTVRTYHPLLRHGCFSGLELATELGMASRQSAGA
jgi:hypothetical protein